MALLEANDDGTGILSKSSKLFTLPEWNKGSDANTVSLGPSGPVALEDLVGADGRCAPPASEALAAAPEAKPVTAEQPAAPAPETAAPPPQPADRPVGSVAGDLAGAPMPQGPPPQPRPMAPKKQPKVASTPPPDRLQPEGGPLGGGGVQPTGGGVALGMTECEAVRRAGAPNNVNIGAEAKGERKVVLTYLGGDRPGIYTFVSGRLKEVERAPEPPAPPKAPSKKKTKKPAKPNTATSQMIR